MFKSAKIESFLRDWIIKRKADSNGKIQDIEKLFTGSTVLKIRDSITVCLNNALS